MSVVVPNDETQGRCGVCVSAISGMGYKSARVKLNNKLKTRCCKCHTTVCKEHLKAVCDRCIQNNEQ